MASDSHKYDMIYKWGWPVLYMKKIQHHREEPFANDGKQICLLNNLVRRARTNTHIENKDSVNFGI